jgi:cytochrome c biogenesis factor
MGDRVLGLIVLLATPLAYLTLQVNRIKAHGPWIALAVPPILLVIGAVLGVMLLIRGESDSAILILFLALPVATAWVVLIQYLRRD